jgi:hypothetical protein
MISLLFSLIVGCLVFAFKLIVVLSVLSFILGMYGESNRK